MVNVRRRGTTEQARRGGYAEDTFDSRFTRSETVAPAHTIEADVDIVDYERVSYSNSGRRDISDDALGVNYTYRTYAAPVTHAEPVSRPAVNVVRQSGADVMPVIRREADIEPESEVRRESAPKERTSGKNKVALFAYLAAVVVLAVLVIVSGVAISNVNAQSDALMGEISNRSDLILVQNATIADLSDIERIEDEAMANGMEKIEDPKVIELLPKVDGTKYEGRTNAFDKFCDWLSNFFGG